MLLRHESSPSQTASLGRKQRSRRLETLHKRLQMLLFISNLPSWIPALCVPPPPPPPRRYFLRRCRTPNTAELRPPPPSLPPLQWRSRELNIMGLPVLKMVRYYIWRSMDLARRGADVSIIAPRRRRSLAPPLEHKLALIEKKDDNDS